MGDRTNIVLILNQDGKYKVNYYVYGVDKDAHEIVCKKLQLDGYKSWKESYGTILCFCTLNSLDREEAKKEFGKIASLLNDQFTD